MSVYRSLLQTLPLVEEAFPPGAFLYNKILKGLKKNKMNKILFNVCGYEKLRTKWAIWVSPEPMGEPDAPC